MGFWDDVEDSISDPGSIAASMLTGAPVLIPGEDALGGEDDWLGRRNREVRKLTAVESAQKDLDKFFEEENLRKPSSVNEWMAFWTDPMEFVYGQRATSDQDRAERKHGYSGWVRALARPTGPMAGSSEAFRTNDLDAAGETQTRHTYQSIVAALAYKGSLGGVGAGTNLGEMFYGPGFIPATDDYGPRPDFANMEMPLMSALDFGRIRSEAGGLGDANVDATMQNADIAAAMAERGATQLDALQAAQHYSALTEIMPEWYRDTIGMTTENLRNVQGITSSFLQGQIPDDVADQIRRARAEQGLSQGLFGQAAASATARDLGLTSLDLMQRGVSMASSNVPAIQSAMMQQYGMVRPPTTDIPSLFSAGFNALQQSAVIPAVSGLQTAERLAIAQAQQAQAQQVSQMNMEMQRWATEYQMAANRAAEKQQLYSNIIGALGVGVSAASSINWGGSSGRSGGSGSSWMSGSGSGTTFNYSGGGGGW